MVKNDDISLYKNLGPKMANTANNEENLYFIRNKV